MPGPRAIVTGAEDPTTYPQGLVQPPMNGAWVNGQWVPLDAPEPSQVRGLIDSLGGQLRDAWADVKAPYESAKGFVEGLTPQWLKDLVGSASAAIAPAFTPSPETDAARELLHQQITAHTPRMETGHPVANALVNLDPTSLMQHAAVDQLADSTTPGGAALQVVPELAMAPLLADLPLVRKLFPKVDAYGKPAGLLTSKTILKRVEAAKDLAPEARTALTQLAEQVGERRVAPAELHALAAGETYTPERVVRKPRPIAEGAKQIPGAPLGVTNARQARGLREKYLQGVERGAAGRDWYEDAGKAILFHANDDPVRARLVAGDMAITSPTSTVSANTGFGIKGYNQATAGVPIEAGRYPTAMGKNIQALHEGGERATGLKRDPFATNIERGGGFVDLTDPTIPRRAVHDIWDAEGHGYVLPSGEPMRTGFGPAQHRFMDEQQDKIIAAANERAVGGFTDWNELKTQAAKWVDAKVQAGEIDPKDAAKSYADFLAQHYAQGSREFTPGATTGHMPELLEPGMEEFRQLYHDIMRGNSGVYDAKMRDQIAAGYGALVGPSFEGPGYFKGRPSPGIQTQVLTGSLQAPGGLPGERILDEGSRRLMDAAEATHGLLFGQDADAYSRLLPAGSGGIRTGWDVALPGGRLTPEQMIELVKLLGGREDIARIPTLRGVRLGYVPAPDPSGQQALRFLQEMDPRMKGAVKALGGKVEDAAAFRSGYQENDWRVARVGQDKFEPIRRLLGGPEKFDQFAPDMAAKIRQADTMFRRVTGGRFSLSPVLDEVRGAIANEGFRGLERLAKKYAIPVTLLVAGLEGLAAPPDQQ